MSDLSPSAHPTTSPTSARDRAAPVLLVGAALLGPAALWEPRLAVFSVLLLVVASAALTRHRGPHRRALRIALGVGFVTALLGMGRFVLQEALPGIVAASTRASGERAVSRLREILFAQDASRRLALIDPDGNGVGGAGRLGELAGTDPVRPGPSSSGPLDSPPLGHRLRPSVPTREGAAALEGDYLYMACVPGADGRLTAHPEAPVDEAAAERRFVAYAWPARPEAPPTAFFIDEHERILQTDNERTEPGPRLLGPERPPSCDDALVPPYDQTWTPWRGKRPRESLPGL